MRRFRRVTAFRSPSERERRNADLFLAELLGLGVPGRFAPRRSAGRFVEELTGAGVPPLPLSEAEAEVPPEAEEPPTPRPPTQPPQVTPGADDDEIIVTRADGTRFRVRRKIRAQVLTRPGRPRAGFCSDDERLFFRVSWCEGTQGTIDVGANPQGAFSDLMNRVIGQINQGASPDQIKQTFENASVRAFVDLDITKVGSWKITGDVRLDINRTGITSSTGRLSADRGWIAVGVQYTQDQNGKQILVTADVPLSPRTIAGKECPVRELAVWWDAECLREVPTRDGLTPPPGAIEKHERLFLYFEHASDRLRSDPKIRTAASANDEADAILRSDPKAGTARLNKRALQRLDYLVGQRYWLASVDGFTSPEGRRRPPEAGERGPGATWEGNTRLADRRAEKVLTLIRSRYRVKLATGLVPGTTPEMRFPPDQRMPKGVGRSEHPRLDDRFGNELEGSALDRAVILGDPTRGLKPFLEQHPEELVRVTPEDRQFVGDRRNPLRKRAERVFENLRRVEIHLRHREPLRGGTIASYYLEHVQDCPTDLIEAAERKWGSRIPFTRPDPPLCR